MIKITFTPIKGSFKESYNERKYFNTINEMLKYIQEKDEYFKMRNIQHFRIKYYTYSENLKTDRFIINFQDSRHKLNFPVGFMHYEEINT